MIKKIKEFSSRLNTYIKTKQFKWFKSLIVMLAFIATNCICFLAGFFLNRDDNMIYKNSISQPVNAVADAGSQSAANTTAPCVTTVPETSVVTTVTTTKINVNGVLLDTKLSENLVITDTEYPYTNTCDFKNRDSIKGLDIPLTKKSFKISYDGLITAGIDASQISVSVDNDARTISVILPEASIKSHETFSDSIQISEKRDNWFNPITPEDYTQIYESQNELMEEKAIVYGLFDDVYSDVETEIETYLMNDEIISEYYSINFIISKS